MHCDVISDTITRVRNAYAVKHQTVHVFLSRMTINLAEVLKEEGYIDGYEESFTISSKKKQQKTLLLRLRYDVYKRPAIRSIDRVSKSSRRLYAGASGMKNPKNNLGVLIMSTSQGVISSRQARLRNVGGEILCSVF